MAFAHDFGGWSGELAYAPEWSDLEAVRPLYCALHRICEEPVPGVLGGTVTLAPFEVAAAWSPRHARRRVLGPIEAPAWMLPLLPRWLYSARASLSLAGEPTLSEFSYLRLTAEGTATRVLGRRTSAAARLRVGMLANGTEIAPPQVRLYGGGSLGVRGVSPNLLGPEYFVLRGDPEALPCELRTGGCAGVTLDPEAVVRRPLGGESLLEASVEGRLWISRRVELAAFLDAGGVTSTVGDAVPGAKRTEWLMTPGVGALLLSPLGPLRLDVAYNPAERRRGALVARGPDGSGYIYLGDVSVERAGEGGIREFWHRLRVQFYAGLPF